MFLFETQAAGGWDSFKTGMESFFKDGLGNTGLQGLAIAVMVIGLVGALFSFVWHKFSQQSRLPWTTCYVSYWCCWCNRFIRYR